MTELLENSNINVPFGFPHVKMSRDAQLVGRECQH